MRRNGVLVFGVLVAASPLTAQENPFHFTGGPVKSANIIYEVTSKEKPGIGGSYEVGVAPDRWIMRMTSPFELAGKKDTLRVVSVTTKDSQYTYSAVGSQKGEGEVSATLRSHLAREYAALNAAGKARFKENVRLVTQSPKFGSGSDADLFITLTGDKAGSETIGGHKCDVYKRDNVTACVLPHAPMVMLRWSNQKDGVSMVAKKVTLNGPIPAAAGVLPKGVQWKRQDYDDADFILGIWSMKKETDPAAVPAATLTKFAVGYLASPGAPGELRQMSEGRDGGNQDATDEDSAEGDSGS